MNIKIKYVAPINNVVGKSEESFEVESGTKISDLIKQIISRYGERFRNFLTGPEKGKFISEKIKIGIQREGMIGTKKQ